MAGILIGCVRKAPRMIEILNPARLARAKDTGALVADILQTLKSRSTVGTSLLDIDRWAETMIVEAGARSCYVDYEPSFGRGPFGHYICTAVNDAVLHGLPYDYTLADGDLLTLDLAISKSGVAADSAISFIVGESKPPESVALISATERALSAGIAAAGPGAHIGDISHAIGSALSEAGYPINTESGVMASDQRCTRTRTFRTPDGPAVGTNCALGCCSHWSRGSWRTPPRSSLMPTGGRSEVRQAAGQHTASTRSLSPSTDPKS
jgi:methionine aminopeptidase